MKQLSEQEENHIQNLHIARLKTKKQSKEKAPMSNHKKTKVHFPFIMLLVALFKDLTDFIPFAGFVMTPLFYLCIFLWFLSKDKSLVRANNVKNIIGGSSALLIDLIPGADFLPEATLFVIFVYLNEKSTAKKNKKQILKA